VVSYFEEEHKFQVSGNKIKKIFRPTRDKVTEQFGILHNKELCYVYRSTINVDARIDQSV
jgi:hypothetical protein